MSFTVIQSGFLSLMQDTGRFGYMEKALSWGGPVDEMLFNWNNQLLQNHPNDAQIEIHQGLLKLHANKKMMVSFCGHGINLFINDRKKVAWCTHSIEENDKLFFKPAGNGAVGYLAVAGGFQNTAVLSSRSTVARLKIGPINGQELRKNDVLEVKKQNTSSIPHGFGVKRKDIPLLPELEDTATIRCIEGFNTDDVTPTYRHFFFTHPFLLSNKKSRMGILFEKNAAGQAEKAVDTKIIVKNDAKSTFLKSSSLYSEGLVKGTIQILPTGLPIILGPDAQTIGGYPKIGTIFSLDLGRLYQYNVDTKVLFKSISIDEAKQIRNDFKALLAQYALK